MDRQGPSRTLRQHALPPGVLVEAGSPTAARHSATSRATRASQCCPTRLTRTPRFPAQLSGHRTASDSTLNYGSPSHPSFFVSLGAVGTRGYSTASGAWAGNFQRRVHRVTASAIPNVDAVPGVRIPPAAAAALSGANKPGDSAGPASVPGKPMMFYFKRVRRSCWFSSPKYYIRPLVITW